MAIPPAEPPRMPATAPSRVCWITGAGGLIGHALVHSPHLPSGWQARALTRRELDLTDPIAVETLFRKEAPDAIIHCAALSKSPACQAQPELARRINVAATRHLAELAHHVPFFFFSTDLVFDGRQGHYVETDPVHPLSIYAETKVEAERWVLENPRHTVLRTSLNHGISPTGDRGFNEETLNAWRAGKVTRLFIDEFRCPIPATATARATWELLTQGATGLFHLAGSERISRFEIGQHLARRHPEVPAHLESASLREYAGAPRSPDTSLNSAKVQNWLSFPLPGYRQAV